jgi:aryl-alcohol dehydrogenase-like predicted oxidoreductase
MRLLGSTGLRVSVVGLGTVKFGRLRGLKYAVGERLPSDGEISELLRVASELGINVLDTAPAYGSSEERLGAYFRGAGGVARDRWVLMTKAGEEFDGERSSFDFSPRGIRASVERSLVRLGTDRVDVVLLHSDGQIELEPKREEAMEELRALQREGKIVAVGASTKSIDGGRWAVERGDVAMLTLNAVERGDLGAIGLAAKLGRGVVIKKALGSGAAAGPTVGMSAGEAVAAVVRTAGVSSVIVGTTSPAHLRQNVGGLE